MRFQTRLFKGGPGWSIGGPVYRSAETLARRGFAQVVRVVQVILQKLLTLYMTLLPSVFAQSLYISSTDLFTIDYLDHIDQSSNDKNFSRSTLRKEHGPKQKNMDQQQNRKDKFKE
jgi:hypothetical protein